MASIFTVKWEARSSAESERREREVKSLRSRKMWLSNLIIQSGERVNGRGGCSAVCQAEPRLHSKTESDPSLKVRLVILKGCGLLSGDGRCVFFLANFIWFTGSQMILSSTRRDLTHCVPKGCGFGEIWLSRTISKLY